MISSCNSDLRLYNFSCNSELRLYYFPPVIVICASIISHVIVICALSKLLKIITAVDGLAPGIIHFLESRDF